MGRLSDALKRSMVEREKQKSQAAQQAAVQPVPKRDNSEIKEPVVSATKSQGVQVREKEAHYKERSFSIREKISMLTRSVEYLAKVKDNSGIDPRVVSYYNHHSPISDQYRIIRTNLKSCLKKASPLAKMSRVDSLNATRVLTISSALHGEGKSITAANLAVVLAHDFDSKVLLVDCDLRKGSVGNIFNIKAQYGLSDILNNRVDYQQVICPTRVDNLSIIPSKGLPQNPLELLTSKNMKLLLEQLKSESFTYILCDTPPLSLFSDASAVGAQTDGIVLVVQAHKTSAQVIKRAKELAEKAHSPVLGFVLTHTDYHIPNVYGYYQYYKYYNKG
ncbi:CpsD/CapB family tyrosine-protein kinase [Thermoproteota archaeon]